MQDPQIAAGHTTQSEWHLAQMPNLMAPSQVIPASLRPHPEVDEIEEIVREVDTTQQANLSWSTDNLALMSPGSTNLLYQTLLVHQPNELSAFFPTTEQRHQVRL